MTVKRNPGVRSTANGASVRRAALRAAALNASRDQARVSHPMRRAAAGIASDGERTSRQIFVSYSHQDLPRVSAFIEQLRRQGGEVTWDKDFIAGVDFERAIRAAIDAACCVIVVWSASAAQSPYVCDEARHAIRGGKLIATHLAGFDLADLPIGFGGVHAVPIDNDKIIARSLSEHGVALSGGV